VAFVVEKLVNQRLRVLTLLKLLKEIADCDLVSIVEHLVRVRDVLVLRAEFLLSIRLLAHVAKPVHLVLGKVPWVSVDRPIQQAPGSLAVRCKELGHVLIIDLGAEVLRQSTNVRGS
jgi:hypothetical protein